MDKGTSNKRKVLLVAASITSFIYIFWRIFFTIPTEYGIVSLLVGVALVIAETVGVIEAFSHYKNLSSNSEPEIPTIPKEDYPHVDVLIATHSESTDILYKTINGCTHMDYPDKSKVHIFICDDTNRDSMKELASSMGVGYIGMSENKHAKAGNLNNALSKTKSPLIATFDADMIPRSNFLMETVPYFSLPKMKKDEDGIWVKRSEDEIDENYKIGFIQTPQSFYNPDLFQYNLYSEQNIPNEQDYFFKEVNVGRNRTNSPIYAGSNTLISREALEEVGGIQTNNITEDFATGINIQGKGYKCLATSKILAHGLAPGDFKSLIKQRQRWGRGCINTIRRFKFIFSKLDIRAKLSYVTCFLYWTTFFRRFIYIMSPILYSVFGLVVVNCSIEGLIFIWLPSYILYNTSLKYISGNLRNQKWSNIVDTIIFPYLVIPIFLECIGITLKKFNVTPKEKLTSKNVEFKYAIPHIILVIISLIGLVFSIDELISHGYIGNIVIIYWLIMNSYFLIMGITFMLSRTNFRGEERFYAKVDVKLSFDGNTIDAVTSDISEGGMSIILSTPEYIPYDKDIYLSVKYLKYEAKIKAKIVHVSQVKDKWKYSFKIEEMSKEQMNEYYQIVYDREHTLATKIKSNTFKEIKANIINRNKDQIISNRKLPRIQVNEIIKSSCGKEFTLVNFNYEYILLKGRLDDDEIYLNINDDIVLSCKKRSFNELGTLYKINNWKEPAKNKEFRDILLGWITGNRSNLSEA